MRFIQRGRRRAAAVSLVTSLCLSALYVRAFVPMRWGAEGVRAAWAVSRFPLTFCLHEGLAKGPANTSAGDDAVAAVRAALAAWQDIQTAALGSINGRITLSGTGIFGASVTAVDLDRNQIYATLSEPDGKYQIRGTPAGRYAIYAEPLDGPATPDQLMMQESDAYYRGMNTSFRTVVAEDLQLESVI